MIRATVVALAIAVLARAASAQSLTLSPAVVPLGGRAGQSTTQHLTLQNGTDLELSFQLVAKDVVVRDGERHFVAAGEIAHSIAATAVFSTPSITVGPGQERSITVTVTMPKTSQRAVVILFQGTTRISAQATVSIGSLLTFDLSGTVALSPGDVLARPPTASTNAMLSVPVRNTGTEPVIARAAAAILGTRGAMVGRVAIAPQRLLPGEHADLRAEYPGDLLPGTYRVITTIEAATRSWTRTTDLVVP